MIILISNYRKNWWPVTNKVLLYSAGNSAQLCSVWQPGWERSLGENGYMGMYGWVPLLSTWNYHNIVYWIYSNIKLKALKKSWYPDLDVIFQLYIIILAFVNQNYINYKLNYSYKLYSVNLSWDRLYWLFKTGTPKLMWNFQIFLTWAHISLDLLHIWFFFNLIAGFTLFLL